MRLTGVRADSLVIGTLELLVSERHTDGHWHARYPSASKTLCGRNAEPQEISAPWLPDCSECGPTAQRFDVIDGSMPDAWRPAGSPPRRVVKVAARKQHSRRRVPHDAIIVALRDVSAELGRTPSSDEWMRYGRYPHVRTIFRRYGSWKAALAAAGLGSEAA